MPFMRYPKTQQEKRKSVDAEEQGVPVRGPRRRNILPDAWDDIFIDPKDIKRRLSKLRKNKRKL